MKCSHLNIATIVILLFCTVSFAQKNEKQELAKLSFLMGNWSGTSHLYSAKDTTKVKVVESVNYILDGN
jgi:hypothetical protein